MEKKNTVLIVIIVIMSLVIGLLGGYFISGKFTNKNNEPEQTDNKTNDNTNTEKPEEKEFKLKNKYSINSDELGKLRMTVEFISNNEVLITSGDGAAVIEQTKGSYEIKDSKLIVTRKYYLSDTGSGDVWVEYNAATLKSMDLEDTQEFIIDKTNNSLEISTYSNRGYKNIVLK